MKYTSTLQAAFISRPNRFIAYVEVDGEEKVCHVKNTGRCKELLIPGGTVILERSDKPERKTEYDLIAVYKGSNLINMDSQAPNKVFGEWAESSGYFGKPTLIKPECKYGASRFDFYIESEGRRIFVEVKGVTLERDGVIRFPDAPTERGVKHINELADAVEKGYEAYIFFVAQKKDCRFFTPNRETHPQFADALACAEKKGVQIRCVNCDVTEDTLTIDDFVEVRL